MFITVAYKLNYNYCDGDLDGDHSHDYLQQKHSDVKKMTSMGSHIQQIQHIYQVRLEL